MYAQCVRSSGRTRHDHILFNVFTVEIPELQETLYYNPPRLKLQLGLWVSGFLPLNFTTSEASPRLLPYPPPKQWNGEILLHVPGVPIPLQPKSRDHWPTLSAQAPTTEFRGGTLAPLELTFTHLQTDLMYIIYIFKYIYIYTYIYIHLLYVVQWCNCF